MPMTRKAELRLRKQAKDALDSLARLQQEIHDRDARLCGLSEHLHGTQEQMHANYKAHTDDVKARDVKIDLLTQRLNGMEKACNDMRADVHELNAILLQQRLLVRCLSQSLAIEMDAKQLGARL